MPDPALLALLALLALVVEAFAGYPDAVYRRIGHPVTWIGALIAVLDTRLNRADLSDGARRAGGVVTLLILLVLSAAVGVGLHALLGSGPFGLALLAILAATLPAQRSLDMHVKAVADGLRVDLEAGRAAVGMIVGRNPAFLDEAGVARAAIESLGENYSDGVVAPLFWTAVLGLPGGIAYKAVNTADSMIGHRTERHRAFGWAAARFDDLVNLPASRLSALFVVLAALTLPGMSAQGAVRAVRRDARHHRSPNAGWPEAAFAGALGLQLNGPKVYGTVHTEDAYMGDGRREATADDIDRSLTLYRRALLVEGIVLATVVIALLVF
ncbi:adenosylcobinamide-phosphate synthase CbiB [Methylobrevis pamukkalensis]|uniref:Cobalamin biosynthesis protein CobD n=1 Tax=Methylobrevis pamukkalensis TaxID=1439726 RepID=A0A1E3H8A7_9HYPH|nr:adenosylcobinamide-phosphate synthase CbiB [Methylobrevis pamukkalensis]ODN72553.1 cobalamin biosynthesis protein [Methylobrevis pamukkalensis]